MPRVFRSSSWARPYQLLFLALVQPFPGNPSCMMFRKNHGKAKTQKRGRKGIKRRPQRTIIHLWHPSFQAWHNYASFTWRHSAIFRIHRLWMGNPNCSFVSSMSIGRSRVSQIHWKAILSSSTSGIGWRQHRNHKLVHTFWILSWSAGQLKCSTTHTFDSCKNCKQLIACSCNVYEVYNSNYEYERLYKWMYIWIYCVALFLVTVAAEHRRSLLQTTLWIQFMGHPMCASRIPTEAQGIKDGQSKKLCNPIKPLQSHPPLLQLSLVLRCFFSATIPLWIATMATVAVQMETWRLIGQISLRLGSCWMFFIYSNRKLIFRWDKKHAELYDVSGTFVCQSCSVFRYLRMLPRLTIADFITEFVLRTVAKSARFGGAS